MKQFIKSKVFNFQNITHLRVYDDINKKKIQEFIKLLKTHNLGYQLERYGDNGDGGYLVPKIKNIKTCFSVGVGNTTKFEKDLGKKVKLFLADKSVKNPKLKNSRFEKKFISSFNSPDTININDWIKKNGSIPCILKIDAEGSEYEIIHSINEENLKKIKILIFEFHSLHMISNKYFYPIVINSLKKILKYFEVCHLHPNNNFPLIKFYNYKISRDLEITFLNKKFVKYKKKTTLPNKLDEPTVGSKKDTILPKYFY